MQYIELPDTAIEHRWVCTQIPDICPSPSDVTVTPDFYGEAGTPICEDCGHDLEYAGTYLLVGDTTL